MSATFSKNIISFKMIRGILKSPQSKDPLVSMQDFRATLKEYDGVICFPIFFGPDDNPSVVCSLGIIEFNNIVDIMKALKPRESRFEDIRQERTFTLYSARHDGYGFEKTKVDISFSGKIMKYSSRATRKTESKRGILSPKETMLLKESLFTILRYMKWEYLYHDDGEPCYSWSRICPNLQDIPLLFQDGTFVRITRDSGSIDRVINELDEVYWKTPEGIEEDNLNQEMDKIRLMAAEAYLASIGQ